MDNIEKKILEIIDSKRDEIISFADDIYTHGELGYKEFRTAGKVKEIFDKHLERTEDGLAITGVKGYLNQDKKDNFSLALIGELDSLRIPGHKYYNPETEGAHCCGHHAQLAGIIGAALALSDEEIKKELNGQLVFFAVPAEEYGEVDFKNELKRQGKIRYGGGKGELIRIGAFDDIDASLAHHSKETGNGIGTGSSNGFVSKIYRIKGKASHAAGAPEKGINALSAATLGLNALGLQRDTFRDEDAVRVHPILTKGGSITNVVPDEAVVETLVRAKTNEAFLDAAYKTDRSFKAGALALGAKLTIETVPGYLPSLPVVLPEELEDAINEITNGNYKAADPDKHSSASSDVGDLQHLQPVLSFQTGGVNGGFHQADFDIVDKDTAYVLTAKLFAIFAYRLLKGDASLAKKVKSKYKPKFKNKEEYIEYVEQFNKTEEIDYGN